MRLASLPPSSEAAAQTLPGASRVLKLCIFATGLAGIVAEYVLSTLATYLVGNAVIQWTLVMSLMLFAMGLGSRLSRRIERDLLDAFILVECGLSLLCAGSPLLAWGMAIWTSHVALVIYALGLGVGLLIGLEIPLATRANERYEALRANISNVMEKDYYGALLGGLLFAFVGLPHLGLVWTPLALGAVNWAVAAAFLWKFHPLLAHPGRGRLAIVASGFGLLLLGLAVEPVTLHGEQARYKDPIVHAEQTAYQRMVLTRHRDDHFLFLNGQLQFSTFDEHRYHEPLAHPAMLLGAPARRVLVLGGGDGLALREIWKHPGVEHVTLCDLDPAVTRLAREHPVLRRVNGDSLHDPRLRVVHQDAARFVQDRTGDGGLYDVILVDLPDPDTLDLMHCYDTAFYRAVLARLAPGGRVAAQATSPVFAHKAFLSICKTMRAAGFAILPYHSHVPSLGDWGFVLGRRAGETDEAALRRQSEGLALDALPTRHLDSEAFQGMLRFGREAFDPAVYEAVAVNERLRPVLMRYYAEGAWAMY